MSRMFQHSTICCHGPLQQARFRRRTSMCLLAIVSITALVSACSGARLGFNAWREAASTETLSASVTMGPVGAEWPTAMVPRSTPPGYPSLDVLECMRESRPRVAATVEDFKAARPARLTPELALFSSASRRLEVTVVTAFSTSRLYMLEGMCVSWGGPLSAAVYQGVQEGSKHAFFNVQKAKAAVQEVFERMEARGACELDIVLFSEVMDSEELVEVLYPLNALRNAALLMARTELIFILDGDMVISADLSTALANPARFEDVKQQCNSKNFMVIPAFDTTNVTSAYTAAEGGKQEAMAAFQSKTLFPFLQGHYDPAHAPTNFTRWYTASQDYGIEYSNGFEPWGLVSRHLTPFFDVRFRGYGQDKIQYLRLLNSLGFGYTVSADSFIVHRPHVKTKAKEHFIADLKASQKQKGHLTNSSGSGRSGAASSARRQLAAPAPVQLFNVTNGFYGDFVYDLSKGIYEILVTEGFERCRQQLPWWRDYQVDGAVPRHTVHPSKSM